VVVAKFAKRHFLSYNLKIPKTLKICSFNLTKNAGQGARSLRGPGAAPHGFEVV